MPTENQILMACLDAHLYEIEYTVVQDLLPRDFPTRIRYLSVVFESSNFLI
jgi:hypothetical protein